MRPCCWCRRRRSPLTLEALRSEGNRVVEPDPATQRRILADQKSVVIASHKPCVDEHGIPTNMILWKSSGYREWDDRIEKTMRETWRYRPYEVNGKRIPVCTGSSPEPGQRPAFCTAFRADDLLLRKI